MRALLPWVLAGCSPEVALQAPPPSGADSGLHAHASTCAEHDHYDPGMRRASDAGVVVASLWVEPELRPGPVTVVLEVTEGDAEGVGLVVDGRPVDTAAVEPGRWEAEARIEAPGPWMVEADVLDDHIRWQFCVP